MSKTYGTVNYLSSFGFTEPWRKQCIQEINWQKGGRGYDLMSGMGETWGIIQQQKALHLIGLDISPEMNARARTKIKEHPHWNIHIGISNF